MPRHGFQLLNVFAESALSGNALCVFERGDGLSDEQMQALALQFNLSETVFLFPSQVATARLRIFTPSFEMPFAGHPTLGSAHAVRSLFGTGNELTLETKAGVIPVRARGDTWTLEARTPVSRPAEHERAAYASMLGVEPSAIEDDPMWVDTGSEQLLVRLADPESVRRCAPDPKLLATLGSNSARTGLAYVWAQIAGPAANGRERVASRFFFLKQGNVVEDPGTGSACANLGGWFLTKGHGLPLSVEVSQGELVGRPCTLLLDVDEASRILVGGRVVGIGSGEISL